SPSSVQVIDVFNALASPNEHVPVPPDADHVVDVAPSTVAVSGKLEPSGTVPTEPPGPSPGSVITGGALNVTSTQSCSAPLPPPSEPVARAQSLAGPGAALDAG